MKAYQLTLIPLLTFSLSACIFDLEKGDKNTDNSPQELVLATNSDYIPKDGDEFITQIHFKMMDAEDNLLGESRYTKTILFSHVNSLPQEYGYQHSESGPYLKTEAIESRPGSAISTTAIKYLTLSNNSNLLINHDVNDQYYSTAEFNESSYSTTANNDNLMVEGEIVTESERNILFDYTSGNEIGIENFSTIVTALNSEDITVQAGSFQSAKTSFQADSRIEIYADLANSSIQAATGHYWLDAETGTILKYSMSGTMTFDDFPAEVYHFTQSSELVYSAELENLSSSNETGVKVTVQSATENLNKQLKKEFSQQKSVIRSKILQKSQALKLMH